MTEFEDALKYGESLVAYHAYFQIQNPGKPVDWEEIIRMKNEDVLGINSIKLFTSKQEDAFHLVLAANQNDASKGIRKATGYTPFKIIEMPYGMDQPLWIENEQTYQSITIRQIKDNAIQFPYYIGLMEKG